jgi:hypothetical protein
MILKEKIKKERNKMLKECWKRNQGLFEEQISFPEMEDLMNGLELSEWEEVSFYLGYIRGLDFSLNNMNKKK